MTRLAVRADMAADLATASWEALGTTALVRVAGESALQAARTILNTELDEIDYTASRFRTDSELERVNAQSGQRVAISPRLHEAIAVALRAAAASDGAVDPTLGEAIVFAGYDRDWRDLEAPSVAPGPPRSPPVAPVLTVRRLSGWRYVQLTEDPYGVSFPRGMRLDLGATAKALAADRAAKAINLQTGAATLVSLGGDIATAGATPIGGWLIHVTDDHRCPSDADGQTIALAEGALATSSLTTRRWSHNGRTMHHIFDPLTALPVDGPWRTVSVAAPTCVEANTASTAAIVLGDSAVDWLNDRKLAARLVSWAGQVIALGGWPQAL